jgi:hypothetical protein
LTSTASPAPRWRLLASASFGPLDNASTSVKVGENVDSTFSSVSRRKAGLSEFSRIFFTRRNSLIPKPPSDTVDSLRDLPPPNRFQSSNHPATSGSTSNSMVATIGLEGKEISVTGVGRKLEEECDELL